VYQSAQRILSIPGKILPIELEFCGVIRGIETLSQFTFSYPENLLAEWSENVAEDRDLLLIKIGF